MHMGVDQSVLVRTSTVEDDSSAGDCVRERSAKESAEVWQKLLRGMFVPHIFADPTPL